MIAAKRWWGRRRHFTRVELDSDQWPHPRPASDPRLISIHLGLAWVSVLQIIIGPAPSSVQNKSFETTATVAFAVMAIVSSALVVYAAYCRSQYWSFVTELAGCLGFVLVFFLYTSALATTTVDWWATNSAGWAVPLLAGNMVRAIIIARRFW